jgi:tetratricopeptide (TPR) repeat protein
MKKILFLILFFQMQVFGYTRLDTFRNFGYQYYQEKNYAEAKKYLDSCVSLDPKNSDCLYYRAMLAMDEGDYQLARLALQGAIISNQNDYAAWTQLGICHTELKSYDTAQMCFQNAVRINSKDAKIYSNWARNQYLKGDKSHAEQLYGTAILMDDKNPKYFSDRAKIRTEIGMQKEAQEDIEIAENLSENKNSAENKSFNSNWFLLIFVLLFIAFFIFRRKKSKR